MSLTSGDGLRAHCRMMVDWMKKGYLIPFFGAGVDPATDVHEFFARLPGKLAKKGYGGLHQLIVTTSYDAVLERAFDEAGEPYDLLSYVAHSHTKDDREVGKFRYTPHRGEPEIIFDPVNADLPIEHTVILKIHGAVDRTSWKGRRFVVTEDDYMDYLARMNLKSYQIPSVPRRNPRRNPRRPRRLSESPFVQTGESPRDGR